MLEKNIYKMSWQSPWTGGSDSAITQNTTIAAHLDSLNSEPTYSSQPCIGDYSKNGQYWENNIGGYTTISQNYIGTNPNSKGLWNGKCE